MESANLGNRRRRIVALLGGPTGSGKSILALALAEREGWEILSADSGQCRVGLSIGTAAPAAADRARVAHHLVGDIEPDAEDSVALYLDRVERVLSRPGPDLLAVGGTNQYLQALRDGLSAVPAPDPQLRQELSERLGRLGMDALWNELAALATPPPDARSNPVRLLRALEKAILARRGRTGQVRPAAAPDAPVFALSVERRALHARQEARLRGMLESGWREEVRTLAGKVPETAPCWRCIGYAALRETLDLPEVPDSTVRSILAATRQYSKRQETWLRNRLDPRWIPADGSPRSQVAELAAAMGAVP